MKFGLIGSGSIGAVRAAALAKMAGSSLTAIHDVDGSRARAVAPTATFHASTRAMIDDPDVEAVIISTPPQFHEQLAIDAVQAGKHVLVEKPMAASVEVCQNMARAAQEAGRLLTVGYNHRYFEAVKLVRDIVRSGQIGKLSHVRAYTGHTGLSEFKASWMYDGAIMGGGTLFDNGTHIVDMVRYLMGDFDEVYGHSSNKVWEIDNVEDNALALVRSAEGVTGSIQSSWTEWKGYRFWIEAYGDRGMASAYYAPMMAKVITLDRPGGSPTVRRYFYPKAIVREKLRGWQSTVIQTFIEELDDFAAVAGGGLGSGRLAVAEDGIRAIQVAKAVYESSRSGHRITLGQALI
ncbi:hypothetical protein BH09PSE3_BH09PSE3_00230 [soil metagenome]